MSAFSLGKFVAEVRHWYRDVVDKHVERIRVAASLASLITALLASDLLRRLMGMLGPPGLGATLIQVALYLLLAFFTLQFVMLVVDLFTDRKQLSTQPRAEYRIVARPYAPAHSTADERRFRALSALANKVFAGDTMNPDVVIGAVNKKAALGLMLLDPQGNPFGFFDIFHPKKEILNKWLDGEVFETDLTPDDFQSIDEVRGQPTIEFFVGAIAVRHRNPYYSYFVAPLLAAAARHYLMGVLKEWKQVNVYTSIFSDAGDRYAKMFEFGPLIGGAHRGVAGNGHDIMLLTLKPDVTEARFIANSERTVFVLDLES